MNNGKNGNKAKLLVVEDEPNLLLGIRDILELDGYDVVTAQHGQQALEKLKNFGDQMPDLIVSDIMMPFMDGIQLLEEIRREESWITIPFIFLTAKGEKTDIQRGKSMGVDDYLIKPFDADDLLVAVDSRLRRHQAISEVQNGAISSIKRNILTILNHEFRTPLTLVVAYADMLKESRNNIEEMSEDELVMFLKEINNGADRLRRLIENFIMLVELETGDAAKTFHWRKYRMTDVDVILHAAHDQIFNRENMEHACVMEIQTPLPPVMADREYLMMIVRELLDNAVKFTTPERPITLRAGVADQELHISVVDQGRGIEPSELERIWQIFYQVDREQHEDQGAGSGLAIVKGLVDMHNGRIDATSKIGGGSCFTLVLPIVK